MSELQKTALIIDVMESRSAQIESGLRAVGIEEIRKISFRDLSTTTTSDDIHLILVNCDVLNAGQLSGLLVYANRNRNSQFLVLARQISIHAYRRVAEMKNIVTLQIPCEPSIFEGLVREILKGMQLATTQRCPRFVTDEPARVMIMDTGLLIPTRMRNYSVGGAFLEYKGISLKVGHSLDINLLSQENPPDEDRLRMSAKVIWLREGDSPTSSSRGAGVQFADL